MSKRVVVICDERERKRNPRKSAVHTLVKTWREEGIEAEYLYGTRRFVPADVAFLHVNLSVVPRRYLRFARRYPVTINGAVRDIRKSTISQNLVRLGDGYEGPVIIKANLNYAGGPERRKRRFSWLGKFVDRCLSPQGMRDPAKYKVFTSIDEVPRSLLRDRSNVVERFFPERDGDLYCVRLYEFLGEKATCIRLAAKEPIVRGANAIRVDEVEAHPDIEARRRELNLDYGKLDFVVFEGRAHVFDVNKTTGAGSLSKVSPATAARRRHRAKGIYEFLSGSALSA